MTGRTVTGTGARWDCPGQWENEWATLTISVGEGTLPYMKDSHLGEEVRTGGNV